MKLAKWGSCAVGLVLLISAGCAMPESVAAFFFQSSPDGDRVIAGSVDNVSLMMQGTLRRLGLQFDVAEQPDKGEIRLASTGTKGDRFVVVLKQAQSDKGTFTRVHVEWEQKKDQQTHAQIFASVDAQTKK